MNRITIMVFGLALTVLLCGAASAVTTIYVPGDHATIQDAVNNATAGDTIYVWNGSYNENVDIGTPHLTLEGEGADVVTVTAESACDSVFVVTAERVNISGFSVMGASHNPGAGIHIDHVDHCNILENNCSENYYGIYTQHRHKLRFFYWWNQTDTTHKQGLSALLTLRFQRFEKAQVVAV